MLHQLQTSRELKALLFKICLVLNWLSPIGHFVYSGYIITPIKLNSFRSPCFSDVNSRYAYAHKIVREEPISSVVVQKTLKGLSTRLAYSRNFPASKKEQEREFVNEMQFTQLKFSYPYEKSSLVIMFLPRNQIC